MENRQLNWEVRRDELAARGNVLRRFAGAGNARGVLLRLEVIVIPDVENTHRAAHPTTGLKKKAPESDSICKVDMRCTYVQRMSYFFTRYSHQNTALCNWT